VVAFTRQQVIFTDLFQVFEVEQFDPEPTTAIVSISAFQKRLKV